MFENVLKSVKSKIYESIVKIKNIWNRYSFQILLFLIAFTVIGGTFVYQFIYKLNFWPSLYHALSLFVLDVKQPVEIGLSKEQPYWELIYIPALAGFFVIISSIFEFAKDLLAKWVLDMRIRFIKKHKYTLAIGLGENNRRYIDSELKDNNNRIIIIEHDSGNIYINHYLEKGCGVFLGTLDEFGISYKYLKRIMISTGNDRSNMIISEELIAILQKDTSHKDYGKAKTVYVHLQNQNYKELFQQRDFDVSEKHKIEFKAYSFYDDVARDLFERHTILGNFNMLSNSSDPFHIILIGDGHLSRRIVYHICMQANLPNRNHLTIHCVNADPEKYINMLQATFLQLGHLDNIDFEAHKLTINSPECYESHIWKLANLSNIVICFDDEDKNLECTANLYNKVYLKSAVLETQKSKVLSAQFHDIPLRQKKFSQFYTFGDAEKLCSREYLIEEVDEMIAKLINFGYGDIYRPDSIANFSDEKFLEKLENKWLDNTKYSDRESSRSQALHINTKLMAMGLKKSRLPIGDNIGISQDVKELLTENMSALDPFWDEFSMSKDELHILSEQLPKIYNGEMVDESLIDHWYSKLIKDQSMMAKLMHAEHDRWAAYHYLNDWKYNTKKNKDIKEHNCLTSLENFDDTERKLSIVYDLYSVVYLPNYLASTGYKIVKIDDTLISKE